jgi:5'-methylthioadenosine phosphorylase
MQQARIGVIGGSGVYDMSQLSEVSEVRVDTPFGAPSDTYVVGTIEGSAWLFCPVTDADTASAQPA